MLYMYAKCMTDGGMIRQLLFQIILLSWPILNGFAQVLPLTKPYCSYRCGGVSLPFPFGIEPGCYIDDWFAIDCDSAGRAFLRRTKLEVLEILVLEGRMRVNYPVLRFCDPFHDTASLNINLEASPFFFSQVSNRFTGIGCNNLASMSSSDSIIGGCMSICDNTSIITPENSCYGINCCQTGIPSGLKQLNASIGNINNVTIRRCKYAFLVEQHWFEGNLMSHPQDIDSANSNFSHVPVVLDWGIYNSSLNQLATNASTSPSYKLTSECKDTSLTDAMSAKSSANISDSIVRCYCLRGYRANPYLLQGCQDIDECKINSTICGSKMICTNTEGSYNCLPIPKTLSTEKVILVISTSLVGLFLLIGTWSVCITIKRRLKKKEENFKRNGGLFLQQQLQSFDGSVDRCKIFDSKELEKVTNHFHVNRILGKGGQGTVYKGMLADGRIIAVKKSKAVDKAKLKEFINEVVILSQINHRNVVKLLGCCLETEVPLLVYEFIPNGTLFQYLHDQNEELPLTWELRLRIATEIAGALSYLHSAAAVPIYHRDIKSTNILLDEKYRAKIADFGSSRSVSIDQTHVTTKVQGTFGYFDPEYFHSSQFTDRSDVYSFGVVLVELLTGKKPVCSTWAREGRNLATYFVKSMEEHNLYDILDAQVLIVDKNEEIMAMASLAKRCLNSIGKRRPTMKEVAMELEGIRASHNDNSVQQNPEHAENLRTEAIGPWDVGFTSINSAVDIIRSPEDSKPLFSHRTL